MLVALLALGLPTAGLASSIDFATGTFLRGSVSNFVLSHFTVGVFGSMAEIQLRTSLLTSDCPFGSSAGTCKFAFGLVDVFDAAGTFLFEDTVQNGTVTKTDSATITASFAPFFMAPSGGLVKFVVDFMPSHEVLNSGTAQVIAIPEPGTLGLLGTGLISLAGLVRSKLKRHEAQYSTPDGQPRDPVAPRS